MLMLFLQLSVEGAREQDFIQGPAGVTCEFHLLHFTSSWTKSLKHIIMINIFIDVFTMFMTLTLPELELLKKNVKILTEKNLNVGPGEQMYFQP